MLDVYQHNNLKYLFYLPENFEEGKKYPLVINLHGAGTLGMDIDVLRRNPCTVRIRAHQYKGYVFAVPLCHGRDWNEIMESVIAWLSELRSRPYIDTDRVYLTGVSTYQKYPLLLHILKIFYIMQHS